MVVCCVLAISSEHSVWLIGGGHASAVGICKYILRLLLAVLGTLRSIARSSHERIELLVIGATLALLDALKRAWSSAHITC